MKKIFVTIIAITCAYALHAQGVSDLERAAFKRDSVAELLAEHRANYAKSESMRGRLTTVILSLEKEYEGLLAEYDRLYSLFSHREAKKAVDAYEEAKRQMRNIPKRERVVVEDNSRNDYMPNPLRVKRDLVANDYFAERLSAADYKALAEAQRREKRVKEAVENQIKRYGELLTLQRQYMEVSTREEADSLSKLFAAKVAQIAEFDSEITAMWSSLYYNKMYIYDLLMERSGNTSMLDLSAEGAARAEREVNENSDLYQSDALVGYYARKRALTEYESQLASRLSLTTSRDSLKSVAAELKNRDYRLSKLSLQRRSFIHYEDIEVKKSTFYNSKNPVPRTKVYDFGVIYRIRIGLFTNRPNISALRGVVPLSYTDAYNKGMYAYFVGGFRTEQEAKEGVTQLKKLGFRDPIVAVWVDGEYYPTLEDMHRSQSQYNLEISGIATLTDDMKAKILSYKSDCTISRIGATFVVGTFDGKSTAESVASDLRGMSGDMIVKVTKKP